MIQSADKRFPSITVGGRVFQIGIALFFLAGPAPVDSQVHTVMFVIANDTGAPAELSIGQVRSIFRGERTRWPDRTRVVIALDRTGIHAARKIYDMTVAQVRRFWMEKVFRGEATRPEGFRSESELVDYVNVTPGAIAVVSRGDYGSRYLIVGGANSF